MSKSASIIQINVQKAAALIDVTDRTVLNLIKLRKFEAIKVGKEWFIDYPSFVSFLQKYKYKKNLNVENEIGIEQTENLESKNVLKKLNAEDNVENTAESILAESLEVNLPRFYGHFKEAS